MSLIEYHKSIGRELEDLKNRFRHLLGEDFQRLSDGRHKESILKNVLSRHLPKGISAKNGFIKFDEYSVSTEIDILLHLNDRPLLFQNDDLVITTPHSVVGGIEVKTTLRTAEVGNILSKISDNIEDMNKQIKISHWEEFNNNFDISKIHDFRPTPWFSLFAYDSNVTDEKILDELERSAEGKYERVIPCICLGPNKFLRFWSHYKYDRQDLNKSFTGWRIYELTGLSFSYFISNMIWQDHTKTSESNPWFALENKEIQMVCERPFVFKPPQSGN